MAIFFTFLLEPRSEDEIQRGKGTEGEGVAGGLMADKGFSES